jgi:hypothetical protein
LRVPALIVAILALIIVVTVLVVVFDAVHGAFVVRVVLGVRLWSLVTRIGDF